MNIKNYFEHTMGFLAKISFTPLLYHSGECLGCPEKRTSLRNYNLFVLSAVFQPKGNGIQKTYTNYQNPVKSYCFLGYFQTFSILDGYQFFKIATFFEVLHELIESI
jgi:hypothetical protein